MIADTPVIRPSRTMLVARLLVAPGIVVLLAGAAAADEVRRLRVEAAALVYAAESAESERKRQILLKEAHDTLLLIRKRYPSASVRLQLFLGGNRTNLEPEDLLVEASTVASTTGRDVGDPHRSDDRAGQSPDDATGKVQPAIFPDVDVGNLREVLGREPSPTVVDENGWTDLHYAAALNLVDLAEALFDAGADTAARLKDDGKALSDRLKRSLSELGLESNVFGRDGYQPLHVAIFYDAGETAEFLIDRGVDINAKDKDGRTPLDLARRRDPFGKITWALIGRGAE